MPRAEPGTPKWLANKMKAKGLQKLKWYCQMCEKQCRDENGFKCHRLSETHQRQMQIFCQDANKFMDEYSSMFEKEFMKLMKTRFCRTRILANTVYTNLISDKTHIHMNSTVWVTLTDFVLYLGKTGKCKIEQEERGWYLEYIDREKIEREKSFQERKKIEYSYEQLKEKKINEAIEEAKKKGKFIEPKYTGLEKKIDEKIVISSIKTKNDNQMINQNFNILLTEALKKNNDKIKNKDDFLNKQDREKKELLKKRPLSSMDLLILENEGKKKLKKSATDLKNQKNNINEHEKRYGKNGKNIYSYDKNFDDKHNLWVCKNIVVKVIDEKHKCYNKKGVIISIFSNEKIKCEIEMYNKEIIYAYQNQLQTVIPKIGKKVLILKGKHKGLEGEIKKILVDKEAVLVSLNDENLDKDVIESMPYDDVSKLSL